ncbi:SIS domain-containing protein [Agromyces lapidis]|uniref:SIS domain-containing protein n=1 Tax=Agromyces lapidis TaxID=279574 RepID=A0ABV5SPE5_9MICO|nr:SIS domain-containing protein [Agromyces lapidis]
MDTAAFRSDLELIPETLERLAGTLDAGLPGLEEVAAVGAGLGEHPSVVVLGMGSSRYAADVVARRFRAAGANATVELASVDELPPPTPGRAVVAVSATGGSVEVLRAIERYRGAAPLIAVTNRPDSALAARADAVVGLGAGVEASGVACRTFRATFPVLDGVLGALTGLDPAGRFDAEVVRRAATANAGLLESSADWLEAATELVAGPDGAWTLAPAERLSSAQQSALMLREVPRRGAFASETGDWSHVDVYLTKTQDYRALVFAGSHWDGQALEWMRERGSRWASVGGELPGSEFAIRHAHDDDARVAVLTELLVGELVAERLLH